VDKTQAFLAMRGEMGKAYVTIMRIRRHALNLGSENALRE
jgi:hypothetical protein